MQERKSHLTIEELAEQVDMPVRTIRYYITEGLLPGPEGRGKAATYGEEHLLRLRLIRLLSNRHMPLTEMSHLLNRLSLAEIHTLLVEEQQHDRELEPASERPPPQEYIATLLRNARAVRQAPLAEPSSNKKSYEAPRTPDGETWKHWELAPGIELHIKAGAEEQHRYLIERICKIAGIPLPRSNT